MVIMRDDATTILGIAATVRKSILMRVAVIAVVAVWIIAMRILMIVVIAMRSVVVNVLMVIMVIMIIMFFKLVPKTRRRQVYIAMIIMIGVKIKMGPIEMATVKMEVYVNCVVMLSPVCMIVNMHIGMVAVIGVIYVRTALGKDGFGPSQFNSHHNRHRPAHLQQLTTAKRF